MSDQALSWVYAEEQVNEDLLIAAARKSGEELGLSPISPATGQLLRILAHGVTTAVEVGTGTGVSGLYLLSSSETINLTTIDVEAEAQRSARDTFARAGIRPSRTRLIKGRSADILPRLADASYGLVLLDGDPSETPGDVDEAFRILKPGGLLVVARALLGGKVADPARRESGTVAMRGIIKDMTENYPEAALIPVGSGLLVVRKPAA